MRLLRRLRGLTNGSPAPNGSPPPNRPNRSPPAKTHEYSAITPRGRVGCTATHRHGRSTCRTATRPTTLVRSRRMILLLYLPPVGLGGLEGCGEADGTTWLPWERGASDGSASPVGRPHCATSCAPAATEGGHVRDASPSTRRARLRGSSGARPRPGLASTGAHRSRGRLAGLRRRSTSLPAVVFFFLAFENTPGTFYRYIGLMPQKTRNGQRADSHPPSVGVGVSVAHGRAFFPTGAPTRQMGREHRCEASLQVARRQP